MSDRPIPGRGPWGFIQAFVFGGALVAMWGMPQWLWNGEVRIEGAQRLSPDAVAAIAQSGSHRPLFRIDPGVIRDRLLAQEAIENVKIRRWLFPARLEISIQERSPQFRVVGPSPPTYMDTEGVAFTLPPAASASCALSAVVASRSLLPAEKTALKTLLDAWPRGESGTLDMRDPASWSCSVDGIQVALGTPDGLDEKLRVLFHLIPLARQDGKALQYVDLRFPEAPTIRTSQPPAGTRRETTH